MDITYEDITPEIRDKFWSFVKKTNNPKECWEWDKSINEKGYGKINIQSPGKKRIVMLTHRMAWLLRYGTLSPDLCVCHACDNRSCVNFNHLWLGTKAHNTKDMWLKGRRPHVPTSKSALRKIKAHWTPEKRRQMGERQRASWTPERRKAHAEKIKKCVPPVSPETRAKISQNREFWTPEKRRIIGNKIRKTTLANYAAWTPEKRKQFSEAARIGANKRWAKAKEIRASQQDGHVAKGHPLRGCKLVKQHSRPL